MPLFLSSVGRMKGEEEAILEAALVSGHHVKAVITLDVSDSEIWRRFDAAKVNKTRDGRNDDDLSSLTRRLVRYHDYTLPVLATYEKMQLLIHIDGEQSTDEVTRDIINALYEAAVAD